MSSTGAKTVTMREREGLLERMGLALAAWSERWFPDPLVFAMGAIVVVFIGGLLLHQPASLLVMQGGKGFWGLIPFTMQMVMMLIGGYVVATTAVVNRLIVRLAKLPRNGKEAVALIALFSTLTSLISWGLSLIFSGILCRECARQVKGMDYRAAGAASYLGLGATWALGLSSSAALLMATPSAVPKSLFAISGFIPLRQTIFVWPSMLIAVILVVVSVVIAYVSAPSPERARTAESFGIQYESTTRTLEPRTKPGEWLEYSPLLTILICAFLGSYLIGEFRSSPQGALAVLDLNIYNLMFIVIGMLMHWRPKQFLRAVADCIPATGGLIMQFPFYAVIFGMMVGTGISDWMAHLFGRIPSTGLFTFAVAAYSAVLGVFIPSGGSKWIIEAPYLLQAAHLHHVNLGWIVVIYNAAEALPNLVNPFLMLPVLGILKMRARDLVGYTVLQMFLHIPIVFFCCWFFERYLPYVPVLR